MHEATVLTDDGAAAVRTTASEILAQYRGLLRELQIQVVPGGLVLHGHASCFYGKQVALHEARRRCRVPVVANRITVA